VALKSILLGLIVEEDEPPPSSLDYALSLAAHEQAHLTVAIGVPRIGAPSGAVIADVRSLLHAANQERLARAERLCERIEAKPSLALRCDITQDAYLSVRDRLFGLARVNDVAVLAQPVGFLSTQRDIVTSVLFSSGRPVIIAPPTLRKAPAWSTIVVAWDGGDRAARAVGDAMHILERADRVEIVCVTPDADKAIVGAGLAAHLSRHCRAVTVSDIVPQDGDVGKTIRAHAASVDADMIVMGAYAHSRMWEMVMGGATFDALEHVEIPTLLSH
jgi:nucleotide-binding universal stress UspA family protein